MALMDARLKLPVAHSGCQLTSSSHTHLLAQLVAVVLVTQPMAARVATATLLATVVPAVVALSLVLVAMAAMERLASSWYSRGDIPCFNISQM